MATSLHIEDTPPRRTISKEELMFNLKFAHLNEGTDWLKDIISASDDPDDVCFYEQIKAAIKDYPMAMRDKKRLLDRLNRTIAIKRHQHKHGGLIPSDNNNYDDNLGAPPPAASSAYSDPTGGAVAIESYAITVPAGSGKTWALRMAGASGSVLATEIWTGNITKISAYFGSYVASYFLFLRFLVYLNVLLGVVMIFFVSMPHLVHGDFHDSSIHSGFFGKLSETAFFYGAFSNRTFTQQAMGITWSYNSPLAYFLTWASIYFLAMVTIVTSMLVRYRRIKQTDYTQDSPYACYVLIGWDYSMTSKEGSKTRSHAISTGLKELILEAKTKEKRKKHSKHKVASFRVLGSLFNLAVLAASAYLIILVADQTLDTDDMVSKELGDFLEQYQLSLLVMAMKLVVPPILTFLLKYERYSPRTQVKMEIGRTALYYVASLIGFLISSYSVAKECREKNLNFTDISNSSMFQLQTEEPRYCCWENRVGQQILQLVFLDLIAHIFVRLGKTLALALFVKYTKSTTLGKPTFQVSRLNLDLVYGQCLVWLGLFFMPTLSILVAINQVIIFYLTYWISLACCGPPRIVFRASRSGTFDLFVLAASLFVCAMPLAVGITELEPSASCGPYKPDLRVYDSLVDKVGEFPGWLSNTVHFVSTPAFVLPVIVVLLFLVIYFHTKSVTYKKEADELRDHISFTRKEESRRWIAFNRNNKGSSEPQIKTIDEKKEVGGELEYDSSFYGSVPKPWFD